MIAARCGRGDRADEYPAEAEMEAGDPEHTYTIRPGFSAEFL
jgi:hypothetical protein